MKFTSVYLYMKLRFQMDSHKAMQWFYVFILLSYTAESILIASKASYKYLS